MAAGNAANGLPAVYPEKVYSDLVTAFRAAEYDPEKVDAVAGATVSSGNFKKVMAALMEMAEKGQPGEMTLPLYEDGVYEVEMPEYDNGWKDFIRVTIAAGKVDSIAFDARNEQGDLKSADEEYQKSMIAGNVANGLPETYPADYAQRLIESRKWTALLVRRFLPETLKSCSAMRWKMPRKVIQRLLSPLFLRTGSIARR